MIRRILLAAVLAVAAFVAVPGTPAQARACWFDSECYTTFYSDATHTTVVGELYESCDGDRVGWGRRTGYYTFTESGC